MPQVVLDTFFSNDCSALVSNEEEKGAPALVVLDTFSVTTALC